MNKTLMPPSASNAERAFDLCAAKHIESIPVSRVFDQWHPQRCPANLLGWLAWAVSVDDWDPEWPEQVKRDVIEASIDIHRHKGTLHAVGNALRSLGISIEFYEWSNVSKHTHLSLLNDLAPYSFCFIAWANQNLTHNDKVFLSRDLYQSVKRTVEQTKPARCSFEFLVGARLDNTITAACASSCWVQSRKTQMRTKSVQPEPTHTELSLTIHLNKRQYAVARFYCNAYREAA
ncbi:phage tail protein I [Veronia nyctiphanis]|uniref:Phage tail protein I n=1 Tax=Veronia nyctiphanis TaxID=1278244 RepID=A0A4Q0YKX1_9GAMM|nr:phage tail protein I [Veronia nyctiphanis]RXJ70654.1 phage tail protein I [Veronia nyctiphanis]